MSNYRADDRAFDRRRVLSAAAVLAIHAALGFALLRGLGVALPQRNGDDLTVIDVLPPPPPPPVRIAPEHRAAPRREGAASPPNLRAKATEIVVPKIDPPPIPSPVVAAPVAGIGTASSAGAAPIPGPGSGSDGTGDGTGSGSAGDGDGGGGGSPLRLVSEHVRFPNSIPYRGIEKETVGLVFTVGVKGRVTDCTVTRPSGNGPLDQVVCDSIRRGLRYRPATDARGRPVPTEVDGIQTWETYRREPPDDDR